MPQIVPIEKVSFPDILNHLQEYVKSRPELTAWKDFYPAGVGQTFLELLAGMGAYHSTHAILSRREAYPLSAKLRSSAVMMAALGGYPVNRKAAPTLALSLAFGSNSEFVSTDPVGFWRDQPLVLPNAQQLGPGNVTATVYIGEWRTVTSPNGLTKFARFLIDDPTIDNNVDRINMKVDNVDVPLVKYPDQLTPDNALILTMPGGATILFGDGLWGFNPDGGQAEVNYISAYGMLPFREGAEFVMDLTSQFVSVADNTIFINDQLDDGTAVRLNPTPRTTLPAPLVGSRAYYTVEAANGYIKLANTKQDALQGITINITSQGLGTMRVVVLQDLDLDDITLEFSNSVGLVDARVVDRGSEEDPIEKIAMMIPGYHAARRAMVSAVNHVDVLLGFSGSLISASAAKKTGVCCTVEMSYLFDNEHQATPEEKLDMIDYLAPFKIAGETIEIVDPVRIGLSLTMTVVASQAAIADDLAGKIERLVRGKLRKLGVTFHIGEVTRDVGDIPGVLAVYLFRPASDKSLDVNKYLALDELNLTLTTDNSQVRILDPDNEGYTEPVETPTDPTINLPRDPTNLTPIAITWESVQLIWTGNSTNEQGFIIERKLSTEIDALYAEVGRVGADISIFLDDEDILPETYYSYRVRAYNATGYSGYTTPANVRTSSLPQTPFAPTGLRGVAAPGQITLTWNDNSINELGFIIQRKKSSGTTDADFTEVMVTAPNVRSWVDTGILPITGYHYRVRARGLIDDSAWTPNVFVASAPAPLIAPTALYAVKNTSSTMRIIWVPSPGNYDHFQVERKLGGQPDSAYSLVSEPLSSVATIVDTGLDPNTSYTWRVRAKSGTTIFSPYSPSATETTLEAFPIPPGLWTVDWVPNSNTSLEVRWDDPGSSHFVEHRKVNTPAFEWTRSSELGASIQFLQVTGLDPNTDYQFRMVTKNTIGESDPSDPLDITTPDTVLTPAVSGLVVIQGSQPNAAALTWSDTTTGETGFVVEYQLNSDPGRWFRVETPIDPGTTTFEVSPLSFNTAYTFRVFAKDATSYSGAATAVYTTPPEV